MVGSRYVIMNEKLNSVDIHNLKLNNAGEILDKLQAHGSESSLRFLTMVQGNTYSDVKITDSNIKNNSRFIVDLWD